MRTPDPLDLGRVPIKAVLFDLDGTLLDTHPLIVRCFAETLEALVGVTGAEERCHRLLGRPLQEMFATVLAERTVVQHRSLDQLIFDYRARMKSLDAGVLPFPGVVDALEVLRGLGLRMAVVTTKHAVLAERHLAISGLSYFFEVVVCGDHCATYKPDPAPFFLALRRLDLDARQAVVVGDSPADILGARAAGMMAYGAGWGTLDRDELTRCGAERVLESVDQLGSLMTRS